MDRSMEIADVLSKTEIVAKLKQMQKASPEMEQRQAASILREKTASDPERTRESEKSDLVIITKEREAGEEKKKYKKDEDKNDGSDQEQSDETPPEHLDLKA